MKRDTFDKPMSRYMAVRDLIAQGKLVPNLASLMLLYKLGHDASVNEQDIVHDLIVARAMRGGV